MTIVEFFFDIISPFSRIQYDLLMRQVGHWKSMQLKMTPVMIRKIFEAAENMPPGMNPTKAAYLMGDLKMVSQYHKIPFQLPPDFMQIAFDRGTASTQQFLTALQTEIDADTFHRLIGKFYYHFFHPTEFRNVCEVPEMEKIAAECGISQDLIQKASKAIDSDELKAKLQKNIDECIKLGAFGLPVTLVHTEDPKWVFGSDRMHIIGHLLGEKDFPILQ